MHNVVSFFFFVVVDQQSFLLSPCPVPLLRNLSTWKEEQKHTHTKQQTLTIFLLLLILLLLLSLLLLSLLLLSLLLLSFQQSSL